MTNHPWKIKLAKKRRDDSDATWSPRDRKFETESGFSVRRIRRARGHWDLRTRWLLLGARLSIFSIVHFITAFAPL